MPAITDIKHHIRSVKQTRQITNAMYLISASRVRRAMRRIEQNHAYFMRAAETVHHILNNGGSDESHPYLQQREGKRAAFLIIAGSKGLAGSYNNDVLSLAKRLLNTGNAVKTFVVGEIALNMLKKHGYEVDDSFTNIADDPSIATARRLGHIITDMYDAGEIDEFHVVYTRFYGALQREVTDTVLLPIELCSLVSLCEIKSAGRYDLLFDPSPHAVMDVLVPQLVIGYIYGALVHANASENSARMTAMESATNSADDMIASLTLKYNAMRQLNITNELSEIVGGSATLRDR